MKRIIVLIIFLLCGTMFCSAADLPSVKFDGKVFTLYYSAKNSESGTFINEYYKPHEGYTSWSELISVHHFPNAYSPIDQAKAFRDYLGEGLCPSAIEVDEENNSAIIDFVLIDNKKLPIILEFNVFKYVKSLQCGTIAFQYAKRYRINNALEVEKIKKSFMKNRAKYIGQVEKVKIPELVKVEVEEGRYTNNEGINDTETGLD